MRTRRAAGGSNVAKSHEKRGFLCIDFGTQNTSAVFVSSSGKFVPLPQNVTFSVVKSPNGMFSLPTLVAVEPITKTSGRVIFGLEVEYALKQSRIVDSDVWFDPKLALAAEDSDMFSEQQDRIEAFKIRYARTTARALQYRNLTYQLEKTDKVIEVDVTQPLAPLQLFMRYYLNYVKRMVEHWEGIAFDEIDEYFENRVNIAVSVPAIWSNTMIDCMRQLLEGAGYPPTLTMVSEPKCAITPILLGRALEASGHYDQGEVEQMSALLNTYFVVIDIGHGTVDVSTHRIVSVDPFRMQSEIPGTGSLHGGKMLNDLFEEYLRTENKFDADAALEQIRKHEGRQDVDGVYSVLARGFEQTKAEYSRNDEKQIYRIIYEGDGNLAEPLDQRGIARPRFVEIKRNVVRGIFDDYLEELWRVIENQVERTKHHISTHLGEENAARIECEIVGGCASSSTIKEAICRLLREHMVSVESRPSRTLDKLLIAKGGLISLLDPGIAARQRQYAREAYGQKVDMEYIPGDMFHDAADARSDANGQPRMLTDRFLPFNAIGEEIEQGHAGHFSSLVDVEHYEEGSGVHNPREIDIEIDIWRTMDKDAGQNPGHKCDGLVVHLLRSFKINVPWRVYAKWEWMMWPSGGSSLWFYTRVTQFWRGMELTWKVEISKDGRNWNEDVNKPAWVYYFRTTGRLIHQGTEGDTGIQHDVEDDQAIVPEDHESREVNDFEFDEGEIVADEVENDADFEQSSASETEDDEMVDVEMDDDDHDD